MPTWSSLLGGYGSPESLQALSQSLPRITDNLAEESSPTTAAQRGQEDELPPIVSSRTTATDRDKRVRIKPFPSEEAKENILGGQDPANLMYPLWDTNGVLFPYTPTIQFNQDVDWKSNETVHTNYETAAYSRTPAVSLTITGKFTVQTHSEGRYLLAVLHFFRTVSKMHFGRLDAQTEKAGLPPPVLLFEGYGDYMFNDLRVVVKNHTYQIDDTVNLVPVLTTAGSKVMLPTILTLSTTLQVVQSPRAQKDQFDLDKFRTGQLMRNGGWI
jgi:hypothetical protein